MTSPIDRPFAAEHLELANRHVAEGRSRVEAQLALIAKLARQGHDTWHARTILRQFVETLALQVETRERIAEELRLSGEHELRR
ncbi:MAG: hypothetical protein JO288_21270 [Hyphomicrobiales bacterium]|nr:hypothetical protein [Hyphomicrobiales bacterium]